MAGLLVGTTGVGGNVQAGNTDAAGGTDCLDELVEHDGGLLAGRVTGLGLVADGVDALVGALAAGALLDLLRGVAPSEVDRHRADLLGLDEALGHAVDAEHRGRTAQHGGVGGHQPDGPGSEHRHALARRDPRELAAVVAGREDVGEQHVVLLALRVGRQLQAVEVRVRHAQVLGLTAEVGPHGHVAVGAAGEAGVDGQAERGVPGHAVLAEAAGHVERHDHVVAAVQRGHPGPEFLDDPEVLVPEDDPGPGRGAAFVHVQVRAADRSRRDAHDHVAGVFDARPVDLLDHHPERFLVHHCLHRNHLPPRRCASPALCPTGAGCPRARASTSSGHIVAGQAGCHHSAGEYPGPAGRTRAETDPAGFGSGTEPTGLLRGRARPGPPGVAAIREEGRICSNSTVDHQGKRGCTRRIRPARLHCRPPARPPPTWNSAEQPRKTRDQLICQSSRPSSVTVGWL